MDFDLENARKEGYSDKEIANYIAEQKNFDAEAARKEGYSDSEILDFLGVKSPQQEQATPIEKPSMLEELGRQVGLTARGAIAGFGAPASMVLDPFINMYNIATDSNVPLTAPATQKMLTDIGLPEPKSSIERGVQAGVEAIAGVGSQAGLAKGALAPLAEKLGTQTAIAATSAPVAQQVQERMQPSWGTPLSLAGALAAGMLTGGATAKAIKMGRPIPKTVTIEDVKNKARESYKAVKDMGISLKPLSAKGMIQKAYKDLDEFNFNPTLNQAHKPIDNLLKDFDTVVGTQRVKFDTLEQLRQAASDLRSPDKDPVTKLLASRLVQSIDEYASGLTPKDVITGSTNIKEAVGTLNDARKNWKVAARAQVLEDVLDIATAKALDPKASENELIRRGLINLAANKKRMSLFNKQEQEAIKKAASGGVKDSLLSLVARFNPARSQITAAGTVAGGMAYDPVIAGATAASGFAADKLQQAYRQQATKNLVSGVLSGNIEQQIPITQTRGLFSTLQGLQEEQQ